MSTLNFIPQDSSLEQTGLIINGSIFPDEVIYENLLPYVLEKGTGLALSHTCKAMHQIMTTFLQNNAVQIYKAAMTQVSNLYLSIRTWTPCPLNTSPNNYPLNTPTEHYKLNASIVKAAKDSGLVCTTHRVLYPKEIGVLSQQVEENSALETIWPSIVAEIKKAHPNLALDPAMTAWGIRTWMSSNPALLETIQKLDLAHSKLSLLPDEIYQLRNLKSLNLTKNQLSTLPPGIGLLKNLGRLFLEDNQLTELPPAIYQLTNLSVLGLCNNQLTTIPPQIGKFTNLVMLDLKSNQLTTIPPQIGELTDLIILDLSNNPLTTLPPEIRHLMKLRSLSLPENCFIMLPPELEQFTGLTVKKG